MDGHAYCRPAWGLILTDSRSFISRAWWLGVFPGLFIMITVLSINFLGDALSDLLDVCEAKDPAHAWPGRGCGFGCGLIQASPETS